MWQTYGSNNLHIVFGDTRNTSWSSLNGTGWRTFFDPPLSYWLSISSELDSHYGLFGNGYVPYNIIVGPGYQLYMTGSGFNETEAKAAIDQAMANFELYPANMIEDQLIEAGNVKNVDLSSAFYNNTGEEIIYSIHENSSPGLCDFTFNGNTMTITAAASIGAANVILKANAGSGESYLKFSVDVSNPDMTAILYEDYENAWPPEGWVLNTTGAGFVRTSSDSYSGTYSAMHADNSGVQDDWLVTPKISITDNTVLAFRQKGLYNSYYTYHGVGISLDNNRYTMIADGITASDNWEKIYIDLSTWAGQEMYLGFNYQGDYSDIWLIDDVEILQKTGIESEFINEGFELYQNYPNPFNPTTDINYSISEKAKVKLTVHNSKGEVVTELVNNLQPAGKYSASFDAGDLSNGIFYYSLRINNEIVKTRKMLLLK